MPRPNTVLSRLLWLWVVVSMAAYLYQFRSLAGPVMGVLGLR